MGYCFQADLAEPVTVGVADLDVAGAAPLAVPDVFTELELVTMKVTDEVETVDGIPVYYGGDYDGLRDPEFDHVGFIGNFDGQSESSEYEDPRDFFTMSGWIGVILMRRMDLMAFSRMTGRPSSLFLIARPRRLWKRRLHRYGCSRIRGVHLFLRRILTPGR